MTEQEINLAIKNGVQQEVYPKLVRELINEKYSIYDELAIQRQRDTKPLEFQEYNAYCESCKTEAKRILQLGGTDND
jgi:hypothetical protein